MEQSQILVKVKRFDQSLPLPAYQTTGAAGFDVYAREEVTIEPNQVGRVPLNVAIELPVGYWAMIAARSSLHKRGLMLANGIGVADEDYCGDDDEYQAALLNFSNQPVTIDKGERICQIVIVPRPQVQLEAVDHLGNASRGGFGSTGSHVGTTGNQQK